MRLLITTQAIDRDDPVLGFFHGWVAELATRFEHIHVICLRKGQYDLPKNVTVHSLGKETGISRGKYVVRFFLYVYRLRGMYDVVFAHMNPHYLVLAGWYWKRKGIRMLFWRNHARMNRMTKIAAQYAHRVFYTSPFACTRIFPHAVQMPVGIDTKIFKSLPSIVRNERSILFLGRLSKVKRPELFMGVSRLLPEYTFDSYGDVRGEEKSYMDKLRALSNGRVNFYGGVKNYETPQLYAKYGVYMNLTPEGSMDKTMLEAAACGALILVSNTSLKGLVPQSCMITDSTPEGIAASLKHLLELQMHEKEAIRAQLGTFVGEQHALSALVQKIVYYAEETI